MTNGPRLKETSGSNYEVPSFSPGTSRTGANGWWKVWNRDVLQDYRDFSPLHRGTANILFADGSVRSFADLNGDGLINNGFASVGNQGGYFNSDVEIKPDDLFSLYSLDAFKNN